MGSVPLPDVVLPSVISIPMCWGLVLTQALGASHWVTGMGMRYPGISTLSS